MVFTESLEEARKQREKNEQETQNNQKKEQLKQNFFNLPEIGNLTTKLEILVKPNEKEKIENRLLLKYEKNSSNFNLKESLQKVLLGENIGGIPSSGILLENDKGETLTKKEKENIYNQLILESSDKPENTNKGTEKELPESAQPISEKITEKVGNILDNTKENQDPKNKESQEAQKNTIEEKYEKIGEGNVNNPEYSVLKNLTNSEEISPETKEIIEITIETNGEFNKDFEESIENKDDLKKIQELLKQIPKDKETIPTNNLSNFKEDFSKLADIAINGVEAKSIKKGEEPKSSEILAYENIAKNYIKIGKNSENKEQNYSTAIKTASANLLKNDTTIKRDKIEFKEAINKIHGENPKEQFEGLVKLIEIKEEAKTQRSAEGERMMKLKKLDKKGEKNKRKELIDKGNKINEQIKTLEKKGKEENQDKIKKLQEELEKIKKSLKEKPKSGEIISGSKLDKNKIGTEKIGENS